MTPFNVISRKSTPESVLSSCLFVFNPASKMADSIIVDIVNVITGQLLATHF